ncbi:hypothetical protein [uncultured Tenacibaculum sp.]|uniref:hypothetical protein n=1 Tax=uncultured Tenacibaculum sp. TaxID=174713 RepID=UPI0026135154|nr:hypothetical protein [uncultured Tenacibaculum sp.]
MIYIVIVLILLVISGWIASKVSLLMNFKNEINKITFISFSTLVFIVLILLLLVYNYLYYPNKAFDKKIWNSVVHERYEMSKNIIEKELLIGKSKQEVIQLLGTKEFYTEDNRIMYTIGHIPSLFNIDPNILCVELENDIVVSVFQYES